MGLPGSSAPFLQVGQVPGRADVSAAPVRGAEGGPSDLDLRRVPLTRRAGPSGAASLPLAIPVQLLRPLKSQPWA